MNSIEIKHAVLSYFRFKRQWICASECLDNDIMVITNKDIIEVEIKVNKYDLWRGEARKIKHQYYENYGKAGWYRDPNTPNRFYICVPTELNEEAIKWVEKTNNDYGIILCKNYGRYPLDVIIGKHARKLHSDFHKNLKKKIMMRVCSENIGLIFKTLIQNKGGVL